MPGGVLAQMLQDEVPSDPVDAAAHLVDLLRTPEPVLMIIDDAEHADIESVQAISTLVRHQRELPVLVVLAMAAPSPALADLAVDSLHLTGLSERAVAALAAARGRTLHPSVVTALTLHTAGNPRDVLALLDEVPDALWAQPDAVLPAPGHVRERTREALAASSSEGRALVEAIAILGESGSLAEASTLAGLPDPLPALDSATAAWIVGRRDAVRAAAARFINSRSGDRPDGRQGDRRRAPARSRHRDRPGPATRPSGRGDADTGCRPRRRSRALGARARHRGRLGAGGDAVPRRGQAHRRSAATRRAAHAFGRCA